MNKEEFLAGMKFMNFFKGNNINSLENLACYLVSNDMDFAKTRLIKKDMQNKNKEFFDFENAWQEKKKLLDEVS